MASFLASPSSAAGYICNLHEHWFTIRPVAGAWWNFNSLQPAPSPVGDAYLDSYLHTLTQQEWSIYVVQGRLPPCDASAAECAHGPGRIWSEVEVRRAAVRGACCQRLCVQRVLHARKQHLPSREEASTLDSRGWIATVVFLGCRHGQPWKALTRRKSGAARAQRGKALWQTPPPGAASSRWGGRALQAAGRSGRRTTTWMLPLRPACRAQMGVMPHTRRTRCAPRCLPSGHTLRVSRRCIVRDYCARGATTGPSAL